MRSKRVQKIINPLLMANLGKASCIWISCQTVQGVRLSGKNVRYGAVGGFYYKLKTRCLDHHFIQLLSPCRDRMMTSTTSSSAVGAQNLLKEKERRRRRKDRKEEDLSFSNSLQILTLGIHSTSSTADISICILKYHICNTHTIYTPSSQPPSFTPLFVRREVVVHIKPSGTAVFFCVFFKTIFNRGNSHKNVFKKNILEELCDFSKKSLGRSSNTV